MVTWDDGAGEALYVGGTFTFAGCGAASYTAKWDGASWQQVGAGLNNAVRALTVWDPDGPGPMNGVLVAGGDFTEAGGVPASRVALWDGASWQALGAGVSSGVRALTAWDPDGPGPMSPLLVAGGQFTQAGGAPASRVASWNGVSWQALTMGVNNTVFALTTWDPDGPGPLVELLIVGGQFTQTGGPPGGGTPLSRVAAWNGGSWQALGAGVNGAVSALVTQSPEEDGPLNDLLIVGGQFSQAGGMPASSVASWDGAAWQPLGGGTSGTVNTLAHFDADGPGPSGPLLIAGGTFAGMNYIASWDGASWQPLGGGMDNAVSALAICDPDGPGPLDRVLVAGGAFRQAENTAAQHIASWDGAAWRGGLGKGLDSWVLALTAWDPDGAGPLAERAVAGGFFSQAGGIAAGRIASWDGASWQALGAGVNSTIYALTTWDPDGPGPMNPLLVAGGSFMAAGGAPASRVAAWDGASWQPLGDGVNFTVEALASWDPDGPGPLSPLLVVGGQFTQAGGAPASHIAAWDGSSWQPLGAGVNNTVFALAAWDPDGAGPLNPLLIAGGQFTQAGGASASRIAAWNGASWQSLGAGVNTDLYTLTVWDPDEDGPLNPLLVAGGAFTMAGDAAALFISAWNGNAWQAVGSGLSSVALSLTIWDPDGPGALSPLLVAGGSFTAAGGTPASRIAAWDGVSWRALGEGLSDVAYALAGVSPGGAAPSRLYAGGGFVFAGGSVSHHFAEYGCASAPPPLCVGDANNDGMVNFADITSVLNNWLEEYAPNTGPGDANHDGVVNFIDITAVLNNWLADCG